MSDELRLPDHLAACEARLAAHSLGASPLNRDELLYRAGWAAAEAELSRRSATPLAQGAAKRGRVIAWSMAGSAAAAALAVAITLSLASPATQSPPRASDSAEPRPSVALAADNAPAASQRSTVRPSWSKLDALVSGASGTRGSAPSAALWALSNRPRSSRWGEPILVKTESASLAPTSLENTSIREMLHQVLPRRNGFAPADGGSSGGVLNLLRPLSWKGDTI